MSCYTKRKWEVTDNGFERMTAITDGSDLIASTDDLGDWNFGEEFSWKFAEANARRICQCVNNFDDLLEACKRVRSWLNQEHKEVLTKAKCEQILYEAIDKAGNK